MYSSEERVRAVELYIRPGKRARATICALGYPGRPTLTAWVRDPFPEIRTVSMIGADAVQQAGVVGLYNCHESAQAVTVKFGRSRTTLYNWKTRLRGSEAPATMTRQRNALTAL